MKMCLLSGYWISVHRFKSCTMKASEWLHLVRRDYCMMDILNESTTIIPWKVYYLFTAVVQKMKMCLISGYWISVHRFKSCTMKASLWLQLVRRDYCMMDILNKSTTIILWKVDYLFTAVVQKMKMCLISGYWISVHRFKSCTMKASLWLQLVRPDYCMMDILNKSTTIILWKVDYLVTAGVLKMKMCLINWYWISVHRFKSSTIKVSEKLHLVRRDFGIMDKLNESSNIIPWKVDYLVTAGVLKMKMCLINWYWISVHRFKSCTMKASLWLHLVRRDFGMLDKLNESSTIIPWKVDYLVTAGVLKMKMYLINWYWISVHRFKSCTMKASEWLRYFGWIEWKYYYYPLKSRLSLHSCGTENEDVPHKWILNFSTSIQVLHNESIGMTSSGSPWLRYFG